MDKFDRSLEMWKKAEFALISNHQPVIVQQSGRIELAYLINGKIYQEDKNLPTKSWQK